MSPTPILLDCDPGHDDAVALLLAHGSPEIELLAVTTVAGNQTLEKVTRNAVAVARVGGIAGVRALAIASEGPFFRSDAKSTAFREWLCSLDDAHDEELPDDTFKGVDAFRQTGVKTRLVILNKP